MASTMPSATATSAPSMFVTSVATSRSTGSPMIRMS
jgi:hypothetical protein